MALVYRLIPVPDSVFEAKTESTDIVVFESTRKQIKTLEKEFYELGYLETSEATPFFTISDYEDILTRKLNSFGAHPGVETKAFFLFPQDALEAMLYCNKYAAQSNAAVWLCEYDIPDDILKKYLGFGYYNRSKYPEFRIPLKDLAELDAVVPETDAEAIEGDLKVQHQRNLETYVNTPVPNDRMNAIRQRVPQVIFAKPNYMEETFAYGLSNKRSFFSSQTITHRSFLSGKWDVFRAQEKDRFTFTSIADKSNGILTEEALATWQEYQKCRRDSNDNEFICRRYILDNVLTNDYLKKPKIM